MNVRAPVLIRLIRQVLPDDHWPVVGHDGARHTAISAGYYTSCALLADGSVACWGTNNDGVLGDVSIGESAVPVLVPGINDAVAISTGAHHSCAILRSGVVQCWGMSSNGQLGDGMNLI